MIILTPDTFRWTDSSAANSTRINLVAASAGSGPIGVRPAASSSNAYMFWVTPDGLLSYSTGSSWINIASGSGTPTTSLAGLVSYRTHLYEPVITSGEEVWIKVTAPTYGYLDWSRSGTSLTLPMASSVNVGSSVCAYGVNVGSVYGKVLSVGSTSFTINVPDTGDTSGTGTASYAVVPGYAHDVAGYTKTGGTLTAGPAGTQLISMTLHTGDRDATFSSGTYTSSGYYYMTLPSSNYTGTVADNVGITTGGISKSIIPTVPLNSAYTESMTRVVGAFVNYDTSSGSIDYGRLRFEGLGTTPVVLRIYF